MLESPFNILEGFKTCTFIKKGLQYRSFPVNIANFLRTLILMKIWEQLLLQFLLLTVNISPCVRGVSWTQVFFLSFLNTGVTSTSLRLLEKHFCVIISSFQMLFNAGAQISDTSFKSFVGILPKIPLFLLFKALISVSISLTSVFKK